MSFRVVGFVSAILLAVGISGCRSCLFQVGGSDNPPQAALDVEPRLMFPGGSIFADACGSFDLDAPPAGYCFAFDEPGAPVVRRPAETATECPGSLPPAPSASYTYLLPGAHEVRLVVFDDACPLPRLVLDEGCGITNMEDLDRTSTPCDVSAATVDVEVLDPPESGVDSGPLDAGTDGGPACTPDQFEPNETLGGATMIGAGTYPGLSICAGDVDFFRFALVAGQMLRVTALHDPALGDLDLIIFDNEGEIVEVASTLDAAEVGEFFVAASGNHRLEVYGFGGQQASYDLVIEIL